jgi:hypothetical protein
MHARVHAAHTQDFVAQIADLCPEHCVGSVIPELLGSEAPEAQLIGLRALYAVCTSVPHDCAAAQDLPASSQRRRSTPLAGAGSGSTSSSNTWGGGARGGSGSTRRLVHVSGCGWWAHARVHACTSVRNPRNLGPL